MSEVFVRVKSAFIKVPDTKECRRLVQLTREADLSRVRDPERAGLWLVHVDALLKDEALRQRMSAALAHARVVPVIYTGEEEQHYTTERSLAEYGGVPYALRQTLQCTAKEILEGVC